MHPDQFLIGQKVNHMEDTAYLQIIDDIPVVTNDMPSDGDYAKIVLGKEKKPVCPWGIKCKRQRPSTDVAKTVRCGGAQPKKHYHLSLDCKAWKAVPQLGWLIQSDEGDVGVSDGPAPGEKCIRVHTGPNHKPCSFGEFCYRETPSITHGIPDKICKNGEHGDQHWHIQHGAEWVQM